MLTTGCSRPPTAHEWAAVAENPSAKPALVRKRVAVPTALATTGFSFNDEPIVKSQHELALATSGSHNLRRRSNCNLCACSFPPCATRSPGRGRACPTLPGSAAMHAEGTASRPPTAKGLLDIGVQPGSALIYRGGFSHRPSSRAAESTTQVRAKFAVPPARPPGCRRRNPHLTSDKLHFTVYPCD